MSDLFPPEPVSPWAGRTPRAWQAECLPIALHAIRARKRAVVSAIMGSGKSVLIAEVCASGRGRVVVTVPTVALVDQIAETIDARCPGEVGRFYTHAKEAHKRVTLCCLPSLADLVAHADFTPPALWIADECHKTESAQVLDSHTALNPTAAIGFSATAFKADHKRELTLWDCEIYAYGVARALADGVIVPFDVVAWNGAEVSVDDACESMIKAARGEGPGLCNAVSIDDAEAYALRLTKAGIPSAAVHSRQSREQTKAVLNRLRDGELACVVHVNMLSEGVDLPWLRWLCMRRPIGSRVRFCQEVGRVLRAFPGKSRALLLDPHDLMGKFSLNYAAILSGMGAEAIAPFEQELREVDSQDENDSDDPREAAMRRVKRLAAWAQYLRALYLAALSAGMIEERVKSTHWRGYPSSEKQITTAKLALRGMASDTSIPPEHRKMLKTIGDAAAELRKGDASDLITLGFAIRDGRRDRQPLWTRLCVAVTGGDK